MCLNYIDEEICRPTLEQLSRLEEDDIYVGYKVFQVYENDLYGIYYNSDSLPSSTVIAFNKRFRKKYWHTAKSFELNTAAGKDYMSGFHCFYKHSDAILYEKCIQSYHIQHVIKTIILQIQVQSVMYSGTILIGKYTVPVFIAKQIKI